MKITIIIILTVIGLMDWSIVIAGAQASAREEAIFCPQRDKTRTKAKHIACEEKTRENGTGGAE